MSGAIGNGTAAVGALPAEWGRMTRADADGSTADAADAAARAEFQALEEQVRAWREAGDRVVLCHGCFDPLHLGHILHFRAARGLGDRLVVTVTPDLHVNKGPDRPRFSQALRLLGVRELRVVDAAAVNLWRSAVETIQALAPHVFAKGADYRQRDTCNPNIAAEEAAVRAAGGRMCYTDEASFSATEIVRSLRAR